MDAPQSIEVRPLDLASDRNRLAQLLDLLAGTPHAPLDAVLAEAMAGRFSLSGAVGAFRGDALVGIAGWQTLPGRTASLWLPRLAPHESESTADAVFAALVAGVDADGVRIAQLLLEAPSAGDQALLASHGFAFLTGLLYMACPQDAYPTAPTAASLTFEPYCEANHARLKAIIEETYRGTLDCPQLNDVRDVDDVLSGYRTNGLFDPGRWLLATRDGRDVGCLLLADYPADGNIELVYMGVVPPARGDGLGVAIARHAGWVARSMGRRHVVVAVDAANAPAVRMYAKAGFLLVDRREVYLRVFAERSV